MKTIYDIGDKVIIVAVVKGMQINSDNKCPLYTIRVPSASGHYNDVYLTETELDEMNGKKRASKEQEHE